MPKPKSRVGGGGTQNADSASRGTFRPEFLTPSPSTLPALLTCVPWEAWNPSSLGGGRQKDPRDITSPAMAMNCEVTRCCLSGGERAGASGQAGRGPGGPQTQDPEKVSPGSLVLKIEPRADEEGAESSGGQGRAGEGRGGHLRGSQPVWRQGLFNGLGPLGRLSQATTRPLVLRASSSHHLASLSQGLRRSTSTLAWQTEFLASSV